MNQQTSHPAWVLNFVVAIDEHHRGFAGDFFRASIERRQVIAAYLAAKAHTHADVRDAGNLLSSADHRSILLEAYGEALDGHRGALRRAGPAVHEERFYTLLYQLLSSPPHPEVAKTISRLQSLDLKKLLVLRMLPQNLARANVVEIVESLGSNAVRQAHDVAEAYNLLVELEVDGDALAEAIRRVRSTDEFTNLWQRWSSKAKCRVSHPVPATRHYRPVRSAAEAKVVARKYRNCMAVRYIPGLLRGTDFFGIHKRENEEAIVHLRREELQIELSGIYGPRNARPSKGLRREAEDFLSRNGVRVRGYEQEKPCAWDSLHRMMRGPFDFDFD